MCLLAKFALTLGADTLLTSGKSIASDMPAGSLGRFPCCCVWTAFMASNTGLIYCLPSSLGQTVEQSAATPAGS